MVQVLKLQFDFCKAKVTLFSKGFLGYFEGILGRMAVLNRMNFRKISKGGGEGGQGSFSIQNLCCRFWHYAKLFPGMGHASRSDEFSERFPTAVDPHPPPLRMVPNSGNHVHAFHTNWLS